MRVKKKAGKATSRRPEVRSLKIQPYFRKNKYDYIAVSEIRLCGNWLEELGFRKDQRVAVTTMKNLLILRPVTEDDY